MQTGRELDISAYWAAALAQRAEEMEAFFAPGAQVLWPNTNERFTAEEFIRANCEYPGAWEGEIERVEAMGPHGGAGVRRRAHRLLPCDLLLPGGGRAHRRAGGILERRRPAAGLEAGAGHRAAHPLRGPRLAFFVFKVV